MIAVNVILIVSEEGFTKSTSLIIQCFSVQEFITFSGDETQEFHLIPIVAVCVAWGKCALPCLY